MAWRSLDELDAGVCDSMTCMFYISDYIPSCLIKDLDEEIEEAWPDDAHARDLDKYNYRYRGGEAYRDVTVRLEPIIVSWHFRFFI